MASTVEWDPAKAIRNSEKHRVSFEEAATVFEDPLYVTVVDEEHSIAEDRFIAVGLSHQGRLLVVAHAEAKGRTRIIMPGQQPGVRRSSMPNQSSRDDYDLRDEYDLATMTVLPRGRYAPGRRAGRNVIVLAPDVAEAFPTDEAVNEALRLVLRMAALAPLHSHPAPSAAK